MGSGAEPLSVVILHWCHTLLLCLVIAWLSLIAVEFACVHVWLLHVVVSLSSHVVISLSLHVLVTLPCHVHGAGSFFVVLGCCLWVPGHHL